jgi:hypothetical protein
MANVEWEKAIVMLCVMFTSWLQMGYGVEVSSQRRGDEVS